VPSSDPRPDGDAVVVRHGTAADAPGVARLHATQIDEGFLSRLGPRFLAHLYRRIARSPSSFLLVAECDGTMAGFVAGATDVGALYKQFLIRDGLAASLTSTPQLLRAWRRALETLKHGTSPPGTDARAAAELLAIVVDPEFRGKGVGDTLVSSFLRVTRRRGADVARVVVGRDNRRAVTLYERSGFRLVEHFEMHPGTTSMLMEWSAGHPGSP
jgi:ribosomal protein S18 acetylase RimI-like enzyme